MDVTGISITNMDLGQRYFVCLCYLPSINGLQIDMLLKFVCSEQFQHRVPRLTRK